MKTEFRITEKDVSKKYKDGKGRVWKIVYVEKDIPIRANVVAICVKGEFKGIIDEFTDEGRSLIEPTELDLILSEEV